MERQHLGQENQIQALKEAAREVAAGLPASGEVAAGLPAGGEVAAGLPAGGEVTAGLPAGGQVAAVSTAGIEVSKRVEVVIIGYNDVCAHLLGMQLLSTENKRQNLLW